MPQSVVAQINLQTGQDSLDSPAVTIGIRDIADGFSEGWIQGLVPSCLYIFVFVIRVNDVGGLNASFLPVANIDRGNFEAGRFDNTA